MPAREVQDAVRTTFSIWGRPLRLRTDNGGPWGSTAGLPTAFELWLVGTGVDLLRNHPRRPEENGVVEQTQGLGKRWAEPGQADSLQQLQVRLDEEDWLQRCALPIQEGRSRRELSPDLCHSGRGYARSWEALCWDLTRALQHLGGYQVPRKVNKQGKVSIYEWDRKVGSDYVGQRVWVAFSPSTCEWRFLDNKKREIRRRAAVELNQENIVNLRIARPKGCSDVKSAASEPE